MEPLYKKYSWRKKSLLIIIFILLCIMFSSILNWVTMPPNVVWMNMHKLKSEGPYDTLFVGTSHGQYGISPEVVDKKTGDKSFNLCMADEYPIDTYYLIKEACRSFKPKKIIYELDPAYWITDQRQGSTAIFFYKELPMSLNKVQYFTDKIMGLDFRGTIFPWSYYKNKLPEALGTIKKKKSEEYKNYDPVILDVPGGYYKERGFLYQNKVEGADKGTFNNIPWNEENIRPEALQYFQKMLQYCRQNNIEFQMITLPVPLETMEHTPESYQKADQYFKSLARKHKVPYKNFNYDLDMPIDRSMDGYWDYDGHMYGDMAEKFSEELGNYLKRKNKGAQ